MLISNASTESDMLIMVGPVLSSHWEQWSTCLIQVDHLLKVSWNRVNHTKKSLFYAIIGHLIYSSFNTLLKNALTSC